jgi:Cytochrome b(C-terminal)/b6/petD
LKIYMYEVHGPAYVPAYGKPGSGKYHKWFPKIFLYAVMLISAYVAILLATASLFPIVLPPAYSAATAGTIVVQPDWYLLWVYQLLKIQIFEGSAAVYLIAALIVFGLLLFLLPFYDRSKRRNISQRPIYTAIGAILIVELIALTVWGYVTPGQIIPNYQAALVLGGLAVATVVAVWAVYRLRRTRTLAVHPAPSAKPSQSATAQSTPSVVSAKRGEKILKSIKRAGETMLTKFTTVFVVFLAVASVSLASAVNLLPTTLVNAPFFVLALAAFVISFFFMCRMLRKFVAAYEGVAAKR